MKSQLGDQLYLGCVSVLLSSFKDEFIVQFTNTAQERTVSVRSVMTWKCLSGSDRLLSIKAIEDQHSGSPGYVLSIVVVDN